MKGKLLSLLLPMALLTGCAAPVGAYRAPAGVTDLSRQFEAGAPAPPEADPAADAAIGTLGAELLRAAREPGENTLLSPLALSMTANGAAEDTLAEFEALLGRTWRPSTPTPPPCWPITPPWGAPRSAPSPTACGWTGGWRPTNYSSPGVRHSMGPGSIRPIWIPTGPAGR